MLKKRDGLSLNVDTMFDAMVKRLHEYKRQLLKLLHVVVLHQRIGDGQQINPRTVLFGAKAAPGYTMAKEIIGLINSVAQTIADDPRVQGQLAVVFPPNYNVTLAETLIPAADLSEQISLAGKEASGTGNMKFALNGALTVGTLDGANVEIRDLVGKDNFFLFGMTEEQAHATKEAGYNPLTYYESDPVLRRALEAISHGDYSGGQSFAYGHVVDSLLSDDPYMVLADFASYIAVQDEVGEVWADPQRWGRMVVHNIARSGFFSSDRSIRTTSTGSGTHPRCRSRQLMRSRAGRTYHGQVHYLDHAATTPLRPEALRGDAAAVGRGGQPVEPAHRRPAGAPGRGGVPRADRGPDRGEARGHHLHRRRH